MSLQILSLQKCGPAHIDPPCTQGPRQNNLLQDCTPPTLSTAEFVVAMKRYFIWALVVLLLIAHQDNWLWDNGTLVFGFMPIGLLYQAGISLAAAITWFLAIHLIWPTELDSPEVASSEIESGK